MKISEIAEYVVKNYPNSCMAVNNVVKLGCKDKDYEEYILDELMSFFNFEVLSNCGCGCPELTNEAMRKILIVQEYLHNEDIQKDKKFDDFYKEYLEYEKSIIGNVEDDDFKYGLIQFMMYQLDACGILEHGSSIGGAWLTELGKMFLDILNTWHLKETNCVDKDKEWRD